MLRRFVTNTRARALVLALFAAAVFALRANAAPAELLPAEQALTGNFVQNGGFADDLGGE